VEDEVRRRNIRDGLCIVYCPHTTAAITINEAADPDVARDIAVVLERLAPHRGDYAHAEGNSDSHIKTALLGPSQAVIIRDGRLALGQWQGIFFCEFDGPRDRRFFVKTLQDNS
jgi:secondary thiamine-phosphate synthase enzyme